MPQIFHDLGNNNIRSTIPMDILSTAQIPDLVLLWRDIKKIIVIELTIPFETNLEAASIRKSNKYASLMIDLEELGFDTKFYHLGFGSRGLITSENASLLKNIHPESFSKIKLKALKEKISRTAIAASFSIFVHRNDLAWLKPELLL